MAYQVMFSFGLGFIIRVWISSSSVAEWLAGRNEIVTPLTSWKRVTEGLTILRLGTSPYDGDLFHEPPLMLYFWKYVSQLFGSSLYIFFIIIDLATAVVIERLVYNAGLWLLLKQEDEAKKKMHSPDSQNLLLTKEDVRWSSVVALMCYLWNPYNIAACAVKSTASIVNLLILLSLLAALQGSRIRSCVLLALASYISFYPIMLVVPVALILLLRRDPGRSVTSTDAIMSYTVTAVVCTIALVSLVVVSTVTEGSLQWLSATYGFILSVPDLSPNIGIFWYFFTEMFEHFRLFFLCVFQINAFIYTVPLTIRLSRNPLFLAQMLLALMAVFKSYPSYADFALHLALLPLWRHLFSYVRNAFIVACMIVACNILTPILWHLWIYAGSANANFYFAVTLVFTTAQIFLATDLLYACLRYDYDIIHGTKPPILNGQPAKVMLD